MATTECIPPCGSRRCGWRSLSVVAGLVLTYQPWLVAGDSLSIGCRVVDASLNELRVDRGTADGLRIGLRARVVRQGSELASDGPVSLHERNELAFAEVIEVGRHRARLRLLGASLSTVPRTGDFVLISEASTPAKHGEPGVGGSSTLEDGEEEDFVPLLVPLERRSPKTARRANLLHGRGWVDQSFQVDPENSLDYSMTRLGTSASLERISGTPWLLDWYGELIYRDGRGFDGHADEGEPGLLLRRLALRRPFSGGEFAQIGRFIPLELPGVGYVDGVQGDMPLGELLRVGAIIGLRPRRRDLDMSVKEPVGVTYASVDVGEHQKLHYSGTLGLLGTLYEGKQDRLAFLLDQRADLSRFLSVYSTSEVDVYTGNASTRNDVRLTRTHLTGISPLHALLTLRAGVDHYERPDTRAEQDLLPSEDERFFDNGFWRYWLGASHGLPAGLRLEEDLGIVDGSGVDTAYFWRVSLTRLGLPLLPTARATVSIYNRGTDTSDGLGGQLSALLPFLGERLRLRPGLRFEVFDLEDQDYEFHTTDVSMFLDWSVTTAWTARAGAVHTFGDAVASTWINVYLEYRW